ncbi:MAG: hypothetical protein KKH08_00405, partial [Candidatus Omnitrophica bacterium]|nr:hypothetical protein [Candidatus Omnitrophota bacterium]
MDNFVDMDIEIRSNSRRFLKLCRRVYGMFFLRQIKKYYKKNFKKTKHVLIDVIFDMKESEDLVWSFSDLGKHIKYLLWGRFTILHASSIRYRDSNIFFIGKSYSGKSTICSAMRECGAVAFSDDWMLLDIMSEKAYIFPNLIGNIRSGVKSAIQRRYLHHFEKYKNSSLFHRMLSMKEEEFRKLLEYHRRLYGVNDKSLFSLDSGKKKNVFILMENNLKNKNAGKKILLR